MNRILLADDDVELSDLLVEYLTGEDFVVDAAYDGKTALQLASANQYDLLVLDVMMPHLNGFDVLRELRSTSSLPVLMLTARGDDVDNVVGLELGADDYLAKPCSPRVLVAHIRAILRRTDTTDTNNTKQHQPQRCIELDDIVLDNQSRQVTVSNKLVMLTSTEYQVLEYLLEHAGSIVNKEALYEYALGRKISPYDRSLDMHVSNLRKKLGPLSNETERIKTIRKVGYQYVRSTHE